VALVLQQVRTCDGGCCKSSPRFPNAEGDDCIYRTEPSEEKGCSLMADKTPIYGKTSPSMPNDTAVQCFNKTCRDWPHNQVPMLGITGDDCCWQWVEE
jgi:hypothetical protein